ncbi:uncharacterized protein KY384_000453 [Bacidia gigantensis]|uniref:uncharacterized protein n=1 Tax=Bacidia gigantensis TaxID=2732470 RepID=UPI001D04B440|nr:uncharacterized protein KY384_000453 [Bacidia gigantensis]KAG8525693.1 hypothetical protein KY384_000453 [Bacidia gigantensis]
MDSFKEAEVLRMEKGGNLRWREFWEKSQGGSVKWGWPGKGGDGEAKRRVEEVYGGEVGEEWKERLSCEVEGREFKGVPKAQPKKTATATGMGSGRESSPAKGIGARSQKEMNEDFFSRKGDENKNRSEHLRPSEGGSMRVLGAVEEVPVEEEVMGEEQGADPLAAIGKGWGWFASTATKGAKSVNEGWIQPGVQKIAEADIATQARQVGANVGKTLQTGTKGAAERFNNFIENEGGEQSGNGGGKRGADPEKKEFWDSFGEERTKPEKQEFWDSFGVGGEEQKKEGSAIGTAAMRKGGAGEGEGEKGRRMGGAIGRARWGVIRSYVQR